MLHRQFSTGAALAAIIVALAATGFSTAGAQGGLSARGSTAGIILCEDTPDRCTNVPPPPPPPPPAVGAIRG